MRGGLERGLRLLGAGPGDLAAAAPELPQRVRGGASASAWSPRVCGGLRDASGEREPVPGLEESGLFVVLFFFGGVEGEPSPQKKRAKSTLEGGVANSTGEISSPP